MSEVTLREAITEVLDGTIVGVRKIDPETLAPDYYTGSDPYGAAVGAIVLPTFDLAISYEASPEQIMQPSPIWIERANIKVTTTYLLDSPALEPLHYALIKSQSGDMGKKIRSALCWPGKLLTNDAGTVTGIINGCLLYIDSIVTTDEAPLVGERPGLLVTEHSFMGYYISTEAVS